MLPAIRRVLRLSIEAGFRRGHGASECGIRNQPLAVSRKLFELAVDNQEPGASYPIHLNYYTIK